MVTSSSGQNKKKKKLLPLALVLFLDLLAVGVELNVFALFHHVLKLHPEAEPIVTAAAPLPAKQELPEVPEVPEVPEAAEPEEPSVPEGDFSLRFPEQFTQGEIISDENSYRSKNLALYFTRVQQDRLIYYTTEIYVRDVHDLRTAFSGGEYYSPAKPCAEIAWRANAVAALSGDFYYARKEGVVVRNGVLYRDTRNEDICVIWPDGSMECYADSEYDTAMLLDGGAWQAWGFGPSLLENGQAVTKFEHLLDYANPRAAIGCVEPGHYFFVMVEGRTYASAGMTLEQLSELFASLGCRTAYNLDGGRSANLYWNGKLVNTDPNRFISDIIYLAEDPEEVAQG